jgi:hypothetical protein
VCKNCLFLRYVIFIPQLYVILLGTNFLSNLCQRIDDSMNTLTCSYGMCLITNVQYSAPLTAGRATRHGLQRDNSSSHPHIFSKIIFSIICPTLLRLSHKWHRCYASEVYPTPVISNALQSVAKPQSKSIMVKWGSMMKISCLLSEEPSKKRL